MERLGHAVSIVKYGEGPKKPSSYFDPNVGLVHCRNDEELEFRLYQTRSQTALQDTYVEVGFEPNRRTKIYRADKPKTPT